MKNKISIFPLNIVVFPSSKYPLHIFEERYKKMINRCLEEKTGFGIIARIKNEFSRVGSYVIIHQILKRYESGELDIIVKAKNRFTIVNISMNPDGYYEAEIDEYNDVVSDIDNEMMFRLKSKFEEVLDKFNIQFEENFWRNFENAKLKSYKLAEKAGLSLEQQQELLAYRNENKRIDYLINHIDTLEEKLKDQAAMQELIMNDGYLNE